MVDSRFSNRQSAQGKSSGSTLRTGSPRGEAESTSMRRPNFFLRWQGAITHILPLALSHDCRHSFFLLTLFLPDEKCNRAHDSELLNFAEAARRCAKRSRGMNECALWIDAEILMWNSRVKYSFTIGPYKCTVRFTSWRSYLQQDRWILHGHVVSEVMCSWLFDKYVGSILKTCQSFLLKIFSRTIIHIFFIFNVKLKLHLIVVIYFWILFIKNEILFLIAKAFLFPLYKILSIFTEIYIL